MQRIKIDRKSNVIDICVMYGVTLYVRCQFVCRSRHMTSVTMVCGYRIQQDRSSLSAALALFHFILMKIYCCDCQKYCDGQQREVSRSTRTRHAPFRRTRSLGLQNYLASKNPGPGDGAQHSLVVRTE
jgi:hypothetical protein